MNLRKYDYFVLTNKSKLIQLRLVGFMQKVENKNETSAVAEERFITPFIQKKNPSNSVGEWLFYFKAGFNLSR